jgi:hypothetical protein
MDVVILVGRMPRSVPAFGAQVPWQLGPHQAGCPVILMATSSPTSIAQATATLTEGRPHLITVGTKPLEFGAGGAGPDESGRPGRHFPVSSLLSTYRGPPVLVWKPIRTREPVF